MREHRLYQADWMLRYYGYSVDEIASGALGGMFAADRDPKLGFALANRALFPLDVNRAPREMLLRVPGLGVRAVDRLLRVRRYKAVRLDDLRRLSRSIKKMTPFIVAADWTPGASTDELHLARSLRLNPVQLDLFAT